MLNAGKDLAAVLQALEVSESSYLPWKNQYGGMKAPEAVRLKKLEEENRRLKQGPESTALEPATPPCAAQRRAGRGQADARVGP